MIWSDKAFSSVSLGNGGNWGQSEKVCILSELFSKKIIFIGILGIEPKKISSLQRWISIGSDKISLAQYAKFEIFKTILDQRKTD